MNCRSQSKPEPCDCMLCCWVWFSCFAFVAVSRKQNAFLKMLLNMMIACHSRTWIFPDLCLRYLSSLVITCIAIKNVGQSLSATQSHCIASLFATSLKRKWGGVWYDSKLSQTFSSLGGGPVLYHFYGCYWAILSGESVPDVASIEVNRDSTKLFCLLWRQSQLLVSSSQLQFRRLVSQWVFWGRIFVLVLLLVQVRAWAMRRGEFRVFAVTPGNSS